MSARQVFDYFLWTNRLSCRLVHDFGGRIVRDLKLENPSGIDGQKAVCLVIYLQIMIGFLNQILLQFTNQDPSQVAPPSLTSSKCIVYSFGINNEWSFDRAMVEYGCQVYAFDPSMKNQSGPVEGIQFFPVGLGHREEKLTTTGWQMFTLQSIHQMMRAQHGVGAVIDYLKIDIEHSEWLVLPQMIESGMLNLVRQLAVEIHIKSDSTLDDQRHLAGILQQIERQGGMVRFDSKLNPWSRALIRELETLGYMSYEIAWYNSQFL